MAKAIGSEESENFGTSHENFSDHPECEMKMDLANNAIGRGFGPNGPSTDCDTHCSLTPLVTNPPGNCAPACKYVGGEGEQQGGHPEGSQAQHEVDQPHRHLVHRLRRQHQPAARRRRR